MQRNTLFGGIALLLAGGVIGAGAMISSSAMAADGNTPPANEVTMINVGADGEAVQCTFTGAEADGLFPELPAGELPIPVPADGNLAPAVGGSGVIEIDTENLPEGVVVGQAVAPANGEVIQGVIEVDGSATVTADGALPVDVQVLSIDEARDGTPEECAAMREQAASGVPAEDSMVVGATGVVSNQP